uniref:HhH-GPD domain-containing protein n=1 Tax=Chlamydomonas euryale TaxID=1486919 RepID=A0A7R9VB72_9CHLO|mmetsp:Transcript_26545/g.78848  ORF Transcript_26545/g.78848 Transcript_26545/m.78848 type:complete len:212 (+) Transcript_26545:430-1065(+)
MHAAFAQMLVELHGGVVPDSFEALEALPGVGHKTASVVMSQVFNKQAFPVDTHIHRLAQRWGLTHGASVEQTEADLKALLPPATWRDAHLQIIYFGREHCPAKGHDPAGCPVCCWAAVSPYNRAGVSPSRPGQKPKSLQARGVKRSASAPAAIGDAEGHGGGEGGAGGGSRRVAARGAAAKKALQSKAHGAAAALAEDSKVGEGTIKRARH